MKTFKSKKKMVFLPPNYQEVLITHEIQYEKEKLNIDIIRKLIYLYSVAMEYYDSINKHDLHQFYFDKSTKMLLNPEVIDILDKNCEKFRECDDIKLFKVDPYQIQVVRTPDINTKRRQRRSITDPDEEFNLGQNMCFTEENISMKRSKFLTIDNLKSKVHIII